MPETGDERGAPSAPVEGRRDLTCDVAVVGAGPTGLTLATLLADGGVDVIVVEKRSTSGDEPRAISIAGESLRTLRQIGVLEALLPEMLVDTGARYFGHCGQLLAETRPTGTDIGLPGKSQFDQPDLERCLAERARSHPRVTLLFDTEAIDLDDRGDHAALEIHGSEGTAVIRATWLVACDGGRSSIRDLAGIELRGSTQVEKWIVLDVLQDPHREKFAEFHCNGRRPTVIVPGAHGRCRYEFMLLPGESEEMTSPQAISSLLLPYRTVQPSDVRRAAIYVAHQRGAGWYRRGRVLLAGDSAHMMPPFAGQGLNAGIRDAANLSWKLAAHVQGLARDELIDTYEAERKPHAEAMIKVSRRIGWVVMATNPIITRLRDTAIRLLGLAPRAKRWVAGMQFIPTPHIRRGCVVSPEPSLPRALARLVGRPIEQPEVGTGGGETAMLDELLGCGWSLISLGDRPSPAKPQGATEHPLWAAIAPTLVHIAPDHGGATEGLQSDGAVAVTAPRDAFGGAHQRAEPFLLLVRPDRYVAAVFRPSDKATVAEALTRYLQTPRQPGMTKACPTHHQGVSQ